MLQELHGQFDEWRHRWINRRDDHARETASGMLLNMHRLMERLARDGDRRREPEVFLSREAIPGWRKAFSTARTRSR